MARVWGVAEDRFQLVAEVSSDNPAAIEPVLRRMAIGVVTPLADGFHIEATLVGTSARDLNRQLLSALRKAEPRTRIRSQWTAEGVTYRFFDYVPKGTRPAGPPQQPA